ncbi:TonB-dependent receptor [Sphingomonas aerolata]|uniref:TonB-dependent receptor n=1 Tax=Sphingomonas aerolata TaxID=185951 RepID=UPI002FDFFCE3
MDDRPGISVGTTACRGLPVTDLRYADREGTETTGRAGIAYRPVDAVTLRVAGYRGWRLPTLNELYRPFRVGNDTTAANALLSPERLTGVEGGVTLAPAPGSASPPPISTTG